MVKLKVEIAELLTDFSRWRGRILSQVDLLETVLTLSIELAIRGAIVVVIASGLDRIGDSYLMVI